MVCAVAPAVLLLSPAKLCGLSLRSPPALITRLREECSSRPLLFHFIIKLLFLTLCFLLRRLSGVWNSLSCCLLTQKGSSGRSSCLCEGAALSHIRIDIFSRLLEMTPSSSFSNANNHHHRHLYYHCFFFFSFFFWCDLQLWSHLEKGEVKPKEWQHESVVVLFLRCAAARWLTSSENVTIFHC